MSVGTSGLFHSPFLLIVGSLDTFVLIVKFIRAIHLKCYEQAVHHASLAVVVPGMFELPWKTLVYMGNLTS